MNTTFVVISDIHNLYDEYPNNYKWPDGDVVIIAGDFLNTGNINELSPFIKWFKKLPYKKKIICAGNHDVCLDESFDKMKIGVREYAENELNEHFIYLRDKSIKINDISIYGTPWQPLFNNWAFNINDTENELYIKYKNIPKKIDILITHCPPYGILDKTSKYGSSLGSKMLYKRIQEIEFKYSIFGHIHGSYGTLIDNKFNNDRMYINASACNENYIILNKPIIFCIKK